MTKEEFAKDLRRLRLAMSRAKILQDEVDVLYSELSFIPTQAWPPIVDLAIQRWDAWPRNIIKECKELWRSWLSSHPESQAKHEKSTCFQCHASIGYIWAHAPAGKLPYKPSAVFRCAHCDNAEGAAAIPRKTRNQITNLGYTIDDSGQYQPGDEIVTPIKRRPPPVTLNVVPNINGLYAREPK